MENNTSEIAKLTERISKDPRSKLFVPLAEEYKKTGDIEMAIHVLSEGLKHNPGYVTARSILGKLLLDQGDLAASQKEFEEVVKAIPDNLLAQKKLGDLNILQSNRDEALKHYKVALALNPGDAEFASLVSDVEAGLDVKERLLQPKQKDHPEQPAPSQSSQQPIAKAAVHSSTGSVPPPTAAGVPENASQKATEPAHESVPPKEEPEAYEWPEPAGGGESTTAEAIPLDLAASPFEEEEAEEVLVVQPLEDITPLNEPIAKFEFPEEPQQNVGQTILSEEQHEDAVSRPEPIFEETSILPEGELETVLAGETPGNLFAEPEPASKVAPNRDFEQAEADDFTTDTLAELYIAQGFYEKAIDIYERMLADNPNSRGLKDKLARVREMAGPEQESGPAPVPEEKTAPMATANIFEEPSEYKPVTADSDEEITIDAELFVEPDKEPVEPARSKERAEENIFAEPREFQVHDEPEAELQTGSGGNAVDDIFMPPQNEELNKARPANPDFEPREYVPPGAEPVEPKEEPVSATTKAPSANRKETIDRLENWLKNIKKEK
jgi:tetratricopeptide (TPR) repeat protein